MATIINNTPPERDLEEIREERTRDSSAGLLTGILVVVLVLVLIAFVGLPYIRSTSTYNSPGAPSTGGPTYNSTSTSNYDYSSTNNSNAATSTNYNYNLNATASSPY